MNSKSLLSTLIYALIGLLVFILGYKACEIKKKEAAQAVANKQFDQQMKDFTYTDQDSTGSAFEADKAKTTYPDGATEQKTETPATYGKTDKQNGIESEGGATQVTTDEEGQKVRVTDLDSELGMVDKPKYMVITGSFKQLANARKSMESLVKIGYTDAEVGRFNRGAFACAIAKRTNDLNSANALAKKLKTKGFPDAFVKAKK
jgi:cell division protein FtsN